MKAWHFTSFGPDFVIVAKSAAEAFATASRALVELEPERPCPFNVMTVTELRGDVLLAPSVMADLEVEQLAGAT